MKTLDNTNLNGQIREAAFLDLNNTGRPQPEKLFFVQFDTYHAVGSDGSIYQIITKDVLHDECVLAYISEDGNVYNYAEDSADFEEDSEELEIFGHCKNAAELSAENS